FPSPFCLRIIFAKRFSAVPAPALLISTFGPKISEDCPNAPPSIPLQKFDVGEQLSETLVIWTSWATTSTLTNSFDFESGYKSIGQEPKKIHPPVFIVSGD